MISTLKRRRKGVECEKAGRQVLNGSSHGNVIYRVPVFFISIELLVIPFSLIPSFVIFWLQIKKL